MALTENMILSQATVAGTIVSVAIDAAGKADIAADEIVADGLFAPIGVAIEDGAADERALIQLTGVADVIAGGAISAGTAVMNLAGQAVAWTNEAGQHSGILGIAACDAAAAGDYFAVVIQPYVWQKPDAT